MCGSGCKHLYRGLSVVISRFSLSTLWVLGIELTSSGLEAVTFIELSHLTSPKEQTQLIKCYIHFPQTFIFKTL